MIESLERTVGDVPFRILKPDVDGFGAVISTQGKGNVIVIAFGGSNTDPSVLVGFRNRGQLGEVVARHASIVDGGESQYYQG